MCIITDSISTDYIMALRKSTENDGESFVAPQKQVGLVGIIYVKLQNEKGKAYKFFHGGFKKTGSDACDTPVSSGR